MTLYFYADETKFEYSQNKNAYGYGVLITRYPRSSFKHEF
jgi:hypothetical protein